jgi:integrase
MAPRGERTLVVSFGPAATPVLATAAAFSRHHASSVEPGGPGGYRASFFLDKDPEAYRRSRRSVVLPSFLRPYLVRQRQDQQARRAECPAWVDTDLVIDSGQGGPRHPDTLSSGWYSFLRRSGLPHVRFHDLRHAHATLLLLHRVHPKVVSERLGHASVGITLDLYSHVLPSMQSEAAEAIDALFAPP